MFALFYVSSCVNTCDKFYDVCLWEESFLDCLNTGQFLTLHKLVFNLKPETLPAQDFSKLQCAFSITEIPSILLLCIKYSVCT